MRLFLGGDVMLGRGVDQILPHPGDPTLYERSVRDARTYVELAEAANGPIPWPVDYTWPWGDALAALDEFDPDVRLVNLETSITHSDDFALGKGIHYRMSPDNAPVLTAAKLDVCTLANNHVLDFGLSGLDETLDTLRRAGIAVAGAGREPIRPAEVGRVVVASFGTTSSGVPASWHATEERPGVAILPDLSDRTAEAIAAEVAQVRSDVSIVSLHWGSNWGYDVSPRQVRFARRLLDAGVDLVYGHSSHHPRPIEIYRDRLILYGCGDLINDYEGIRGYERYRDDLRLLYLVTLEEGTALTLIPMQVHRMRLRMAGAADREWLCRTLNEIGPTRITEDHDGFLKST